MASVKEKTVVTYTVTLDDVEMDILASIVSEYKARNNIARDGMDWGHDSKQMMELIQLIEGKGDCV